MIIGRWKIGNANKSHKKRRNAHTTSRLWKQKGTISHTGCKIVIVMTQRQHGRAHIVADRPFYCRYDDGVDFVVCKCLAQYYTPLTLGSMHIQCLCISRFYLIHSAWCFNNANTTMNLDIEPNAAYFCTCVLVDANNNMHLRWISLKQIQSKVYWMQYISVCKAYWWKIRCDTLTTSLTIKSIEET